MPYTVREFDLRRVAFVNGGFDLPRGKQNVAWENGNTILVAREWTSGDLTASGYPYIVKRLRPRTATLECRQNLSRRKERRCGHPL